MSVLVLLGRKCTLAVSRAAPNKLRWVGLCAARPIKVRKRLDRETDGCQTNPLCLPLNVDSVMMLQLAHTFKLSMSLSLTEWLVLLRENSTCSRFWHCVYNITCHQFWSMFFWKWRRKLQSYDVIGSAAFLRYGLAFLPKLLTVAIFSLAQNEGITALVL